MTNPTPNSEIKRSDRGLDTNLTLIERAQAGDPNAWDRIVHVYTPIIDYWVRQRGIFGHDMENARQEVFVRLAKSLQTFQQTVGGSFRGWLRTITHNLIKNMARKIEPSGMGGTVAQQMIHEVVADFPPLSSMFDSVDTDDDPVESKIIFGRIMDWIESHHTSQQADVFRKLVLEGKTPADVAKELSITVNIVYQTKSRILARVRSEFGDIV